MAFLEPVLGGLAAFMLGFAWYTALFGKAWQAETGVTGGNPCQLDMQWPQLGRLSVSYSF